MTDRAWRLCKRRFAAHAFDGDGARLHSGRWNLPGVRVVYTSSTLSLAALEALVHMDADDAPDDLVALPVDIPEAVAQRRVSAGDLPAHWRTLPAPSALQELGSDWARSLETAVLSVPSAIVPQERNFILNPAHPDFTRLVVGAPQPFAFDPRLLK